MDSPEVLLSAPRLLWGNFWRSWENNLERFGMIFLPQDDVQSENSEKLESDDPLNEHAMFLRSPGLRNETKIIPKRAERRKKNREEAKKEKRGENSALQSVRGALWGEI